MKPAVLASLCEREELEKLEGLDLHEQRIGPKEAPALGKARMPLLEHLDLWGNPLGDEGLAAIVASPHLARLKHLHLYKCRLTKASLVALAASVCLPSLEYLDLHELEGCDAEAMALLARGENLRHLKLGNGVLTDETLEQLAALPLRKLEHLGLPGVSWRVSMNDPSARNLHTERGARALLGSPYLGSLKRITGLFEHDATGPLGAGSPLAAEFRARFGDSVV
jgi:hypothetical protein